MHILMLSPYLPWPLYGGSSIRMFHILRELSRRGHQIVLLAGREGASLPPGNILDSLCEEVCTYELPSWGRLGFALRSICSPRPYPALKFQTGSLRESLHRLLQARNLDLIWVNLLIMVDALSPDVVKGIPVVLDEHESQELMWRDYLQEGSYWQRLFALINLAKLKRLEGQILPMLRAVLCVSKIEETLMQRRAPRGVEVWTVPNGVDVEFLCPTPVRQKETNNILLCGSMCVRRNSDAATWFVKAIFPKIRRAIPDVELWIVGSSPRQEVWSLRATVGVHVTGSVEDVRPYYNKAKVAVAPYRFGAGTRLKILEAMAMGVPIVATDAGCQGIDVVDGQHILIANTEIDFSERVIELLRNPQRGQTLAEAARALVEQKYDWKAIVNALEPKLQQLVRKAG